MAFGQGAALRLLARRAAGEHSGSKRFPGLQGALVRIGVEGDMGGISTSGEVEETPLL